MSTGYCHRCNELVDTEDVEDCPYKDCPMLPDEGDEIPEAMDEEAAYRKLQDNYERTLDDMWRG